MKYKRDANERNIISALTKVGAKVYRIESRYEKGCPDLLVFFRDKVFALEVKSDKGLLSDKQLSNLTLGAKCVRTEKEALYAIGAIK